MLTLREVSKRHPDLFANGYRVAGMPCRSLVRDRDGFAAAVAFLQGVHITTQPHPHASSYGLKHVAEIDQGVYVSAGAMIAALIAVGVPVRRSAGTPNVQIWIGRRWMKAAREAAEWARREREAGRH